MRVCVSSPLVNILTTGFMFVFFKVETIVNKPDQTKTNHQRMHFLQEPCFLNYKIEFSKVCRGVMVQCDVFVDECTDGVTVRLVYRRGFMMNKVLFVISVGDENS